MKKTMSLVVILLNLMLPSMIFAAEATDHDQITQGFNNFAFDLYRQIKMSDQNMIISPFSLSSLLGLLVPATAENTRFQLMQLLHINPMQNIATIPIELEKMTNLNILAANALWADKNFSYKPTFLNTVQQNKSIQFKTVDFIHYPNESRQIINQWVEKNTKNLIKNLLGEGSITANTRLVLTNAIYFKELWQLPFKRTRTQEKPFMLPNHHEIQVSMMQQKDRFLYAENDQLQLLQLNYTKGPLAMVILLPKKNHDLSAIKQYLTAKTFEELLKTALDQEVDVSIPKFKFASTFNALEKTMQTMGLIDAFINNKANFSNMTDDPLIISNIIQKAMIQVDEEGTVAAAATAVVVAMTALIEPIVFNANHPFLFIIFDTKSKLIFFMGEVINPKIGVGK